MADKKISELTIATTAVDGDYLVINKGDTTTQKINFSNLANQIKDGAVTRIVAGTNVTISPTSGTGAVTINASGGGGGGDASTSVIHVNFPNVPLFTQTIGKTPTPVEPALTANTGNIKMPDGTTSALIICEFGSDAKNPPAGVLPVDGEGAATYIYSCTITGGNFNNNGSTTAMGIVSAHNHQSPANPTGSPAFPDGVGEWASITRNSKSALINFADGANISFAIRVDLRKGRRTRTSCGAGRIIIIPFTSGGPIQVDAATDSEGVWYGTSHTDVASQIDEYYPPLTQQEIDNDQSNYLKSRIRYVLQAIYYTLQNDNGFDTAFPPSVDTGVAPESGETATGTNGNFTPRELLNAVNTRIMSTKRMTGSSYDSIDAYITQQQTLVSDYVAFTWDWDSSDTRSIL